MKLILYANRVGYLLTAPDMMDCDMILLLTLLPSSQDLLSLEKFLVGR